jgi:hypothetical protein
MFQKDLQKEAAKQEPKVYRYKVRKGEYVYSILRDLGLEEERLPKALQEVKDLNPQIQDLGQIQPGQEIILPQRFKPEQAQKLTSKAGLASNHEREEIPTRTYQVQKGEHLVQILRQELKLPDERIFDEYLNLVLELNPDLGNPDLLQAGDRIQLPLLKQQTQAGPGLADEQPHLKGPQEKPAKPVEAKAEDPPKLSPQRNPQRQTLLSLLRLLDFRFAPGQEMFLPLPNGDWLQLNLEQVALARTPWNFSMLFVPESKSSLLQKQGLQELGFRLCPVGDWALHQVLQQLQEATQRRLILWPRNKSLILSAEQRVLELQADLILVQLLGDKRQYHLLYTEQKKSPGIPELLLSYLQSQDIYYYRLDPESENRFARIDPPKTQNISLPRLRDLEPFAQALSRSKPSQEKSWQHLKGLLQDQASLQKKRVQLSWSSSTGPGISLTLRLLQIKTEDNSLLLLHPEQENPYLLALLRQAGYNCYVF